MAMFVHLADEKVAERIRRNGINRLRRAHIPEPGIFAVPVVRSFFVSHQWLRELKRRGAGSLVGIYFRIPDGEPVWMGHYGKQHRQMTAAAAVGAFFHARQAEGFEVIIPGRIAADEIHKIRELPQVVGWRYYPGAYGKAPCGCEFCQFRQYGGRKLREAYEKG